MSTITPPGFTEGYLRLDKSESKLRYFEITEDGIGRLSLESSSQLFSVSIYEDYEGARLYIKPALLRL
jgi:hypothetical protein